MIWHDRHLPLYDMHTKKWLRYNQRNWSNHIWYDRHLRFSTKVWSCGFHRPKGYFDLRVENGGIKPTFLWGYAFGWLNCSYLVPFLESPSYYSHFPWYLMLQIMVNHGKSMQISSQKRSCNLQRVLQDLLHQPRRPRREVRRKLSQALQQVIGLFGRHTGALEPGVDGWRM